MVITGQDGVYQVEYRTVFGSRSFVWHLDDQPRVITSPKGDEITVRYRWEGEALLTITQLTLANGSPGTLTATRRFEDDGRTMRVDVELSGASGHLARAVEVYHRR